ncbi:hypothetical protein [Nevskia ramosa]|uniref:hypothetical protein n=1 Tax=Nevskia ramosa TaxID=64002 RepID=UPI00041E4C16|nr:hypothetical protein [Nevskia ramosa]
MKVRAFALAFMVSVSAAASTIDIPEELQQCRSLSDREQRLACFDVLAFRHSPPRFAGRHGATTEAFVTTGPQRLRYQSDGAIFVMYLRDAEGAVLQNITLPGGGEDSYRIDKAGTYSLQVNGSETWRIWIDPP